MSGGGRVGRGAGSGPGGRRGGAEGKAAARGRAQAQASFSARQDGVVLGADTRATEGMVVADKNCSKIHYISSNI